MWYGKGYFYFLKIYIGSAFNWLWHIAVMQMFHYVIMLKILTFPGLVCFYCRHWSASIADIETFGWFWCVATVYRVKCNTVTLVNSNWWMCNLTYFQHGTVKLFFMNDLQKKWPFHYLKRLHIPVVLSILWMDTSALH